MREVPSSSVDISDGSEAATDLSLGVSYDEGGEGLGDPSQVAQVCVCLCVCVCVRERERERKRERGRGERDPALNLTDAISWFIRGTPFKQAKCIHNYIGACPPWCLLSII